MVLETEDRYQRKIKAAYLLYKENKSKQEIAKLLGVSRPTLSKYLTEIIEEGIVTIQINDPRNYHYLCELSTLVQERYSLNDAIVVDAVGKNTSDITDNIGNAAAIYLQSRLKNGLKIGLTGGHSIHSMIMHLSKHQAYNNIEIAATTGALQYTDTVYHSNVLVQQLSEILGGTAHFLFAPTYADSEEQAMLLTQNSQIHDTLDICASLDIAIVGISDRKSMFKYLPKRFIPILKAQESSPGNAKIVGAINTILINENGSVFCPEINNCFIGMSSKLLSQVPDLVVLAGGSDKYDAIQAALRTNNIKVLITDKYTAEFLLQ